MYFDNYFITLSIITKKNYEQVIKLKIIHIYKISTLSVMKHKC